jgi:DNA-binding CsgD family transcriptional regulator
MVTNRKQPGILSKADQRIATVIAERMLTANSPDARWAAIQLTLHDLGATAINAAVVCAKQETPFWFRSSLPQQTRGAYAERFIGSDFIVSHVARSRTPLRWRTADRIGYEADHRYRDFSNFIRDSGDRSILSLNLQPAPNAGVSTITYCSTLNPTEVMSEQNMLRIETAIRLLLPWLDWPDDVSGSGLLPLPGRSLTVRELQALRLLAGGLMNARIADAMGISEAMVSKHLRSACRKLGAKTREEAIAKAIRATRI